MRGAVAWGLIVSTASTATLAGAQRPADERSADGPRDPRAAQRRDSAVVTASACTPQPYRFADDCRGLAAHQGALRGPDRLRYVPLARGGTVWLTLGGELRGRLEALDHPNFGVGTGDRAYTARGARALAHADLRTASGWRAFVQLAGAWERGRRPAARTFDRSAPDLQQGFVELPVPLPAASATLRLGRQELDLGGTRLVGARDVANLRLAFDMAHLRVRPRGRARTAEVVAFWGRPVVNAPGAFDDGAPGTERFYGVTLRGAPRVIGRPVAVDLLLLGRERAQAVYVDARGAERRQLIGVRIGGQSATRDLAAQLSYETGHVGAPLGRSRVAAYGVAATAGYRFTQVAWGPRVGVDLGLASGDRRRGDGRLNSYDPLYPNLGYFTDAPVDYPVNWMGAQPSLTVTPHARLVVRLGTSVRARASRADGVYAPSARPVIAGPAGGAFVDALTSAHATWRPTRHVQLDAGYVHGSAGRVVTAAGGRDLDFGVVQALYRF